MIDWSQKRSDDRCHRPREQGSLSLSLETLSELSEILNFPYGNINFPRENPFFFFFVARFVYKTRLTGFPIVFSSSPPRGQRGRRDEQAKESNVAVSGHQKAGARRHQKASIEEGREGARRRQRERERERGRGRDWEGKWL